MRYLVCMVAALGLLACASGPEPSDKLAASQASIRAAEEVGAPNVPSAALHLQLAKEQVEQAKQLMKADDNQRAKLVLMRAEADAELALALAREQTLSQQAEQALNEARALERRASGL